MVGASSLRTFQSVHANHRTYHWFLPQLEDFLGGRHIPITGLITILLPQPEDFLRMHTNHRIYHKKNLPQPEDFPKLAGNLARVP